MSRYFRELSVAAALAVVLAALAIFAPAFYQPQPLLTLITSQVAPTLVVACGMTLVIICRQIDISVGSVFAICGVCGGLMLSNGMPIAVALPASVLLGALFGAFNGALIAGLGLPSIVVTLATMVTWREALRWLREGVYVNIGAKAQWFGMSQGAGQWTIIIVAAVIMLLLAVAMKHLSAGRFVYAVGTDAEAARLAGIRPRLVTFLCFVFIGGLTGLAAMMSAVQSPQVDPTAGGGLELRTIAAVVVGGVSISGGRGNLWGVVVGLLLLSSINPALTYLGVSAFWEKAIQGAIILLAVVADGVRSRKQK
ncbi:MAG TPA: ABC transporter permease [Opitutaceae bacterium]|nr:ABC transporter permease [Opitutaceae bacterium]